MPTLKQLQAELSAAKAEIAQLQQQNASLRERLVQVSHATDLPAANPSAATRPQPSQKRASTLDPQLPPPAKIPRPNTMKLLPSQAAAVRTFSPPSSNQGFKYLYVPVQRRIPISQLHSRLRRLHINSSRALDIHYPDHHLVVLLIHNDYEPELCSQLNKFAIIVRKEYDPLGIISRTRLILPLLVMPENLQPKKMMHRERGFCNSWLTSCIFE
ncbi:hypothetical protein RMATCC62417_14544 [Rhizopus microsporus]|nr:hypothetical protein RMATCC62417_14544 [Rhizopus microsporus]